jgi:hypothetical protein
MINEIGIINRLQKDMDLVISNLLEVLQEKPEAILLCGGYGRNEGAWIEDEKGLPAPYNDYDFAVISNSSLSTEEYNKLRIKLAKLIGIRWIDIDFYKPSFFQKQIKPTIKSFDLLYASKVVYGDTSKIFKIKNIKPEKISKGDIINLYITRIWTFLGSWSGPFHDLEIDEARFFKNQMAKAILAACDMLLISKKLYTGLYSKRVEIISNKFSDNVDLCQLANWALNEKLRPSNDKLFKEEMKMIYKQVKNLFNNSFEKSLPRENKFFLIPSLTRVYFQKRPSYWLHVCNDRLVRHQDYTIKHTEIFSAQNYIFHANSGEGFNYKYLEKCSNILYKWGYLIEKTYDYDILREKAAWARNNIFGE